MKIFLRLFFHTTRRNKKEKQQEQECPLANRFELGSLMYVNDGFSITPNNKTFNKEQQQEDDKDLQHNSQQNVLPIKSFDSKK